MQIHNMRVCDVTDIRHARFHGKCTNSHQHVGDVDDVTLNTYCRKSSMYISTVKVIARRSYQVSRNKNNGHSLHLGGACQPHVNLPISHVNQTMWVAHTICVHAWPYVNANAGNVIEHAMCTSAVVGSRMDWASMVHRQHVCVCVGHNMLFSVLFCLVIEQDCACDTNAFCNDQRCERSEMRMSTTSEMLMSKMPMSCHRHAICICRSQCH